MDRDSNTLGQKKHSGVGAISFLNFLYVTVPPGSGAMFGWKVAGITGGLVGLLVGLLVGIGNHFGLRMFVAWAVRWEKRHPKSSGLLLFFAFMWTFVSSLLGFYVTILVIHYFDAHAVFAPI